MNTPDPIKTRGDHETLLHDDLLARCNYWCAEAGFTYHQVLGVIEMLKHHVACEAMKRE